jgi:hypothetical protein
MSEQMPQVEKNETNPEKFNAEKLSFMELKEAADLAKKTFQEIEKDGLIIFQDIHGHKAFIEKIEGGLRDGFGIKGLASFDNLDTMQGGLALFETKEGAANAVRNFIQDAGYRILKEENNN